VLLPEVAKTDTIESGFQRPEGGWGCLTASSLPEAEAVPTQTPHNDDDDDNDDDQSESSSLPSESSGIFYR
jgi:hypothetical protein